MIGILIISHGALGESLIHAASHVLGKPPMRVRPLGVSASDEPERIVPRARELVRELDDGNGVLVLTDIYGATPCNTAMHLLEKGRVEGLSGVSLPMLVRALTYRNESLAVVVEKALLGGREGVVHMNTDCCGDAQR